MAIFNSYVKLPEGIYFLNTTGARIENWEWTFKIVARSLFGLQDCFGILRGRANVPRLDKEQCGECGWATIWASRGGPRILIHLVFSEVDEGE